MQYHPVPFLFSRDRVGNCVLIGDDPVQIRFVEQFTGRKCVTVESVSDDEVLGHDDLLVRMYTSSGLKLSPPVKNITTILSLGPITAGGIGANTLVRMAATILKDDKLERAKADILSKNIGKQFEQGQIQDLRVGLWETVWLLTGPVVETKWRDPWDNPSPEIWMPKGTDPQFRFNSLAKKLTIYILIRTGGKETLRQMHVRPHVQKELENIKLDVSKVYDSMKLLSRWKIERTDPYPVAARLTQIWSR